MPHSVDTEKLAPLVQIKLEFGSIGFVKGGKPENPRACVVFYYSNLFDILVSLFIHEQIPLFPLFTLFCVVMASKLKPFSEWQLFGRLCTSSQKIIK